MRVLGEALYSTPEVVIRELVQNAHDSIERKRIEGGDVSEGRIVVSSDATRGELCIEDTGAGLTGEEIKQYLATVGRGYTRDLRDQEDAGDLIGYFGMGFLSAFVVSDRVVVETVSHRSPEESWRYSSQSGETYGLEPGGPRPPGTKVTLTLTSSFDDLVAADRLGGLLARYCCLLRHPIEHAGVVVNGEDPPWRLPPETAPIRRRRAEVAFVSRFERSFEPVATFPLLEEEGGARGVFWIHGGGSYATTDLRSVTVFVRGMLIGDNERDLLPPWAGFVGLVLECEGLNPTASRETIQKNATYDRVAAQVHRSLLRGLEEMAAHQPDAWRRTLMRHNEALIGAAVGDSALFDLLRDEVTVSTSDGELTMPQILKRSEGKIHLTQSERGGFEELLFRAQRVPVVNGHRFAVLPFCKRYAQSSAGALVRLGTAGGDAEIFRPTKLDEPTKERLEALFAHADRSVEPARFTPTYLPFVVVRDRDIELKRRVESDEASKRIGAGILALALNVTSRVDDGALSKIHVNLSCPAIIAALAVDEARLPLARSLLAPLADLLAEPSAEVDVGDAFEELSRALAEVLESP